MNGGHKHWARTVFEHAASPPAYLCLLRCLPTAGTALTPSENMGGQGGRGNCSRCWGSGLGERPPPRAGAEHSLLRPLPLGGPGERKILSREAGEGGGRGREKRTGRERQTDGAVRSSRKESRCTRRAGWGRGCGLGRLDAEGACCNPRSTMTGREVSSASSL